MAKHVHRDALGRFVCAPETLWRLAQEAEAVERAAWNPCAATWRGRELNFSPAYWRCLFLAALPFFLALVCHS